MFPPRLAPSCVRRQSLHLLLACVSLVLLGNSTYAQSNAPVARLVTGNGSRAIIARNYQPLRATTARATLSTARAATARTSVSASVAFATSDEKRAFELINNARRANGLAPLALDTELCRVARLHSGDMAANNFFNHHNPEGLDAAGRARQEGVSGWRALGENIALNQGYEDPAEFAVERWLKSAKHRANLTNAAWTHTGIGVARAADGTFYFTQVFIVR